MSDKPVFYNNSVEKDDWIRTLPGYQDELKLPRSSGVLNWFTSSFIVKNSQSKKSKKRGKP